MHTRFRRQLNTAVSVRWSRQGNQAKYRDNSAELYLSYDQITGS
ncbi:MAG: hypothetical protein OSB21_04025 [Myxococcota bacterium]|nr:hypothetical protein [Myxococcota bacterium]